MSSTPEQAAAVENPNECKLICALPGSGKTFTMVNLTEKILQQPKTKVLMVTFTNASTDEMQHRIEKRIGVKLASRVKIRTFAKIMLEQHKPLMNGRRLILGAEFTGYLHRVFKKLGICISKTADYLDQIDKFGRDFDWQPTPNDSVSDAYIELLNMMAIYNRIDLNMVAKELVLAINDGLIEPLKFTHILADEFQDTDQVQFRWLLAHRDPQRFITVVGDDDQSIYGWRGAVGYQNMLDFKNAFNASVYILTTCFRCSPYILGTAQVLIEKNKERIAKDMHSSRENLGEVKFCPFFIEEALVQFNNEKRLKDKHWVDYKMDQVDADFKHQLEYKFLVELVKNDFSHFAILARTNAQLDTMEQALGEQGIPARRLGGKSIFDSPNTIAIIKLLHGLTHPRYLTNVIDGLGWLGECEAVLQNIFASGQRHGFSSVSLNRALDATIKFQHLSNEISIDRNPIANTARYLTTFFDLVRKTLTHINPKDIAYRNGSLNLIEKIMGSMKGTIVERSSGIYDISQRNNQKKTDPEESDKIVLSTLTGAKGLQWQKVLIINVHHGSIPSLKGNESELEEHLKIEEERRLLYVGMTRAEDLLLLHYTASKPSLYLSDLK